jgi:2-dehydropantoate 2-reductase
MILETGTRYADLDLVTFTFRLRSTVKFTVIGAGAIGGTVGAHLARSGHEVLLCDADPDHVEAINQRGLQITGPVEQFAVHVPAVTPDHLPASLDGVVLVSVKTQHTVAVAELLRGRVAAEAVVVSMQNGLTADVLGDAVGRERLLVCFVNFGADYLEPGVVIQGNVGTFRIGELDGAMTERLTTIAAALPYAEATDSIVGYLWGKEAYGAMLFAGAVSDLSIADHLEDPRWRPLMLGVAREVLAQAPVVPLGFDGFDPADLEGSLARLVTFNRGSAKSHSGIYRDLMVRRRPTEVAEQVEVLRGPLTHYVGELIRAIERGERTCEVANLELLAAYERLERIGRPLNAVVRAVPAPRRAASGPLHGMPVAVKDMIDVAGLPRGNGNPAEPSEPAAADAPVITLLRAAAADVFAMSSLLEYAAGAPHPELPEARNPVRPERTAGGSSGGSAALVGGGVCPAALGTDTGGSVRIPAAYCGVVGIKPTHGLVPVDGVTLLAPTLDHVGVLADTVATTARVLGVLAATDYDLTPPPRSLRIGVLVDQIADPRLDPELAAITRSAIERLRGAGAELVDRDGAALAQLGDCLVDILLAEAWQAHGDRVRSEPDHYGPDTLRLFKTASLTTADDYRAALARRAELLPAAARLLEGVDVLLGPAVPYAAPIDTPPIDTPEGDIEGLFSGPYNVTGQPAIVLPCGMTRDGLPVALQLAAAVGDDEGLLRAAAVVEAALAIS